jgi:WD40 repeat protein
MRWRLAIAALLGAAVAAAVWFWPHSPRWRSSQSGFRLDGFSANGKAVVSYSQTGTIIDGVASPTIWRWDAETGKLLGRVGFKCEKRNAITSVVPSADGMMVLVGEGMPWDQNRADLASGEWYLHDGRSGARLRGPIPGLALVPAQANAQNSNWFFGFLGDPFGGPQFYSGLAFISAKTGEIVSKFASTENAMPAMGGFAPDGSSAAVAWLPKGLRVLSRPVVKIVEVPSGRVRCQFQLPERQWVRIANWDGQRLEAVATVLAGPNNWDERRTWVFDTSQNPVGDGSFEPLLNESLFPNDTYCQHGPGWLARFSILPASNPTVLDNVIARLKSKLGMVALRSPGVSMSILEPRTGTLLYQMPRIVGHPVCVSPDGKRMACAAEDMSIEVWDLEPPGLRWQLALALGLISATSVLGPFELWRRRTRRGDASGVASHSGPSLEIRGQP